MAFKIRETWSLVFRSLEISKVKGAVVWLPYWEKPGKKRNVWCSESSGIRSLARQRLLELRCQVPNQSALQQAANHQIPSRAKFSSFERSSLRVERIVSVGCNDDHAYYCWEQENALTSLTSLDRFSSTYRLQLSHWWDFQWLCSFRCCIIT